jgi:hypothetical protein
MIPFRPEKESCRNESSGFIEPMDRSHLSLKFRVRYEEGLVQTFDRRAAKDIEADSLDSPIHRIVAQMISRRGRKVARSVKKAVGIKP